MISILGKPGDPHPKLQMTPRQGFRFKAETLDFDLVYGHRCSYCPNVVQALFKTERKINLWPYEETTILSQGSENLGEVLKVVPDIETQLGYTCYGSEFFPQGAQRITLINHLVRPSLIADRIPNRADTCWSPGERPCILAGVWSHREDLLVKDLCLISGIAALTLDQYNLPTKVAELLPDRNGISCQRKYRWVPTVGVGPPMVLVERQLIEAAHHYRLEPMLEPFRKKA